MAQAKALIVNISVVNVVFPVLILHHGYYRAIYYQDLTDRNKLILNTIS
jgi:hypothetical protein